MKYDYSIVIPVYNRLKELECCLFCLMNQEFSGLFEVIVCDDGSTDNILDLVRGFEEAKMNIKYIWQPDDGFRAGHARNKGVAISKGDNIIFLDSDIIVKKDWLSEYNRIRKKNKDVVICGRYDFLFPAKYTVEDVIDRFDMVVSNKFVITPIPKNELFGADIRKKMFDNGEVVIKDGGPLFGGNVCIRKHIFESVGGFDENIVLHGGEDSCLGLSLEEVDCQFLYSDKVIGWHLYHYRNQAENRKSLLKNVDYIERKFKKGKYAV